MDNGNNLMQKGFSFTKYYKFWEVAKEHYKIMLELIEKREERFKDGIKTDQDSHDNTLFNENVEKVAMIVITFSVHTLESFINHYGSEKLTSKTYFENYVDDMKFLSKWAIIPRLVTGSEIDRNGQGFEYLSRLYKIRNSLVHDRTVQCKLEDLPEIEPELASKLWIDDDDAHTAIKAVKHCITELSEIDPSVKRNWLDKSIFEEQ